MPVNRLLLPILILMFSLGSFWVGGWVTQRSASKDGAGAGRKILYYVDPMHPAYRSDKPGIAPDCGMELVPVYEDGAVGGSAGVSAGMPAWTVRVSPEKRQLIGVLTAVVEQSPRVRVVRTTGRVAPDETRLYRMNANADVWVRRIFPATTGSLVKKNDPLMSYYTSAFFGNATSYMYALDTLDRHQAAGRVSPEQIQIVRNQIFQAVQFLQNIGVSDAQLERMARTRKVEPLVEVVSPIDGFVLRRGVSLGQYVPSGGELYQIADLQRVWVLADLFENEAQHMKPDLKVKVSVPHQQRIYPAAVSSVPPQFDANTRTLKFRLEVDNPGLVLRPDMFVDVEVPVTGQAAITVPTDAVVDTGVKKTVYVEKGNGVFEPRRVETGWRAGDQVEIVRGLKPGEKIVVSGTFLIDSESRMKAAAVGIFGEISEDPVCGVEVDQSKAKAGGRTTAYQGRTYYFSSDKCKNQFDADPAKFVRKATGTTGASAGPSGFSRQEAAPLTDKIVNEALARPVDKDSEDDDIPEMSHQQHRIGPMGVPHQVPPPQSGQEPTKGKQRR